MLAAAGLALSAVAPNIPFLFFSAGVLLGNLYSQALCSYIYRVVQRIVTTEDRHDRRETLCLV